MQFSSRLHIQRPVPGLCVCSATPWTESSDVFLNSKCKPSPSVRAPGYGFRALCCISWRVGHMRGSWACVWCSCGPTEPAAACGIWVLTFGPASKYRLRLSVAGGCVVRSESLHPSPQWLPPCLPPSPQPLPPCSFHPLAHEQERMCSRRHC